MTKSGHKNGLPRGIELALALVALAVLSPLLLAVAILIKLSSSGPVIFCQKRMGRLGRPFAMYKFRSMHVNRGGPLVTVAGDSRITAVGRFLRRTKIDELPTLCNVVLGDMCLVGPRPEVPAHVELSDPLWQRVLEIRPGITDPVTLKLRNEEELLGGVAEDAQAFYKDRLQRFKLREYVEYLENRTWKSDLAVLLQTVATVLLRTREGRLSVEEIRVLLAQEKPRPVLRMPLKEG